MASIREYDFRIDILPVQYALSEPRQLNVEDFPWLLDHNANEINKRRKYVREEVLPTRALDGNLSLEITYRENGYVNTFYLFYLYFRSS